MMCDAIERKAIYPQTEENKSVKKKIITQNERKLVCTTIFRLSRISFSSPCYSSASIYWKKLCVLNCIFRDSICDTIRLHNTHTEEYVVRVCLEKNDGKNKM